MISYFTGGLSCWDEKLFTRRRPSPVSKEGLRPSEMSIQEKVQAALSVGAECIQPEELQSLFEHYPHPVCYDGFEPSGRMHLAQALLKAQIVNTLTSTGCVFVFWVGDWFAMLNNKMGGDLDVIQKCGKYFIEIWKSVGMDMTNVRFLWASEEIRKGNEFYWERVMDIARVNNISRIKRCCQILGRSEGDDQTAASIMYPCMQCADVFFLEADICQLGMDQRKVNMLAREYAELRNIKKPIIISHGMMPGLGEGDEKMSKSKPTSAIFVDDQRNAIKKKLNKSFCPPGCVEGNPVVAYIKMLIFGGNKSFEVKRSDENGGNVVYDSSEAFESDYIQEKLHPADVKQNLVDAICDMLAPIHNHFEMNAEAAALLKFVEAQSITR